MEERKKIICIVGPTASGKTALSIALAKKLGGEVVSADSMQIYKGMDIGTAKPTEAEMEGIPHHMLSIIAPDEDYSVARYVSEASACVDEILAKGKIPIIVGGTGLYIDSLVKGTEFADFEEDKEYRNELFAIFEKKGASKLHRMLSEVDPERAMQIHENNVKRVIRALEVYKATGRTISEHDAGTRDVPPKYDATYIGLMYEDRQKLYDRINLRVDLMEKAGLVSEVERILAGGVSPKATSMQAIGYKEFVSFFEGRCTLEEAKEAIKQGSRRYAKRQMTWFKRNEKTNWISADKAKNLSDILQASMNFISFEGI